MLTGPNRSVAATLVYVDVPTGHIDHRYGDSVRFVRLFFRGLKDVYDQFVLLMVVSLMWWVCVALIVTGPPATVALFRFADPRNQIRKPELGDFFGTMKSSFGTSWAIAGFTLPVFLILLWNSLFFRGSDSGFAIMVPLWVVMMLITAILALYAFATVAAMESRVRNAFRGATYLLIMWPFTSGLLILLLTIMSSLFAVLVLPLFLLGPAVGASVVNRFVLAGYDVEVIDPSSPTQERSHEVARGIDTDSGFRGWARRARGETRGKERRR